MTIMYIVDHVTVLLQMECVLFRLGKKAKEKERGENCPHEYAYCPAAVCLVVSSSKFAFCLD